MALSKIPAKLRNYAKLVMFSHTIFSLPFGLISMIWAASGIPDFDILIWILLALIGARNGANAFNRIADRFIDEINPRTNKRPLITGEVSTSEACILTLFCFGLMAFSAYQLNLICFILLPFAISLFIFYSYTKRITWICHFILGMACGGAPVGAWIAVTASIGLVPILLGAAVCFWVAGFDIIYATQDIQFDKKEGLYSIPAKFGLKASLIISRLSHLFLIVILLMLYFVMQCGIFYLLGVLACAILLCIEHINVSPNNQQKMILASYGINQIISITFFMFCMLDYFILK